VIGLLNFINTTMTNILSRKQELAMLQSIGMTAKQCRNMLVLECMYFVLIAAGVFVSLGYPLSYVLVQSISAGSPAYTYHWTPVPFLICFPVLAAAAFILPHGMFRSLRRGKHIPA
jgi:putative ABC transport system permease protein